MLPAPRPAPSRAALALGTFALGALVLFAAALAAGGARAETVCELRDPRGDDHGDGRFLYPSRHFKPGDLDVTGFKVENKGDKTVFTVEFAEPVRQPQRGAADELGNDFTSIARYGFWQFNVDVYIDTDRRPGSGFTRTLPGRHLAIDPETAWDVAVMAGPRPSLMKRSLRGVLRDELLAEAGPADDAAAAERLAADIDRRVEWPLDLKVRRRTLSFSVPQAALGGPARDTWAYTVLVTGADLAASLELMSSVGLTESLEANLGVLPVSPGEWTSRFGGGRAGEPLQPPVVDMFVPAGQSQEALLGDFDSRAGRRAVVAGVVPAAGPRTAGAAAGDPWRLDAWHEVVGYEIFVRSFRDSDGDGIGDFNGLTSMLDYLNDGDPATDTDLGVGALWLMPVFASPSYHGYDTVDYYRLNPQYGTPEDFARLLAECRRRGIRVVLDLMLNHTGSGHPWFVASANDPASDRRDWYVWRDDDPGWTQPWGGGPVWHEKNGRYYYGIFWSGMPDLNYRNPAVMAEAQAVSRFWLDRGVDGFRLDAARHLVEAGPGEQQNDTPETHAAWRDYSAFMRREFPDRLMLGEIWADTDRIVPYYGDTDALPGGDEFAMTFDFPLSGGIVQAVNLGDAGPLDAALTKLRLAQPAGVLDGTFLANHDMTRLATQLGGDPAKLRQAAAVLLTLPGTPWLYYGEEVGLRNGPLPRDEDKRTPMPWTGTDAGFTAGVPWHEAAPGRETANVDAQTGDPQSLLSRYRRLIRVRQAHPALARGEVAPVAVAGRPRDVIAWTSTLDGERLLVVHNLADEARTVAWALPGEPSYALVFGDPGVAVPAGGGITLPARATGVWTVR